MTIQKQAIQDVVILGATSSGLDVAARLGEAGISQCQIIKLEAQSVVAMSRDAAARCWQLALASGGQICARTVVFTSSRMVTDLVGDDRQSDGFEGERIDLFSWPQGVDLKAKKVALVGGGIDAVTALPSIVAQAESVKVFQRKPVWILPNSAMKPSEVRKMLGLVPAIRQVVSKNRFNSDQYFLRHQSLVRTIAQVHLQCQVGDPWIRRQLTPNRQENLLPLVYSNEYYPALLAENCKLFAWPVVSFCRAGVHTAEGIEHQVDCIVDGSAAERLRSLCANDVASLFLVPNANPELPGIENVERLREQHIDFAVVAVREALSALTKPVKESVFSRAGLTTQD